MADDSNEIEFRTVVRPGGDEAEVGAQVGHRVGEAYSEALLGARAELPPIDASNLGRQLDESLAEVSRRLERGTAQMAARAREALQLPAAPDPRRERALLEQQVQQAAVERRFGGAFGSDVVHSRQTGEPVATRGEVEEDARRTAMRSELRAYTEQLRASAEAHAIEARETRAGANLIRTAQDRAFSSYEENIAATSEEARSARDLAEQNRIAQRYVRDAQERAFATYGGAGGPPPPGRPALPGGFEEPEDWLRNLQRLRQEMLAAQNQLLGPAAQQLGASGSQLGGQYALRTDEGVNLYNRSGKLTEQISTTEALARAQDLLVQSTRAMEAGDGQATESVLSLTRAERNLAIASREVEVAQERVRKAVASGDPVNVARAANELEDARARRTRTQQEVGGPGGFMTQFYRGITMARGADGGDNNAFLRLRSESGEFLGAIARYQAAYAIIFTLSRGFSSVLQAEIATQDGMIEFRDALGGTADEAHRLAGELGEVATRAGGSVAEAVQTATRGVFAFGGQIPRGDDGERDQAVTREVARASVRGAAMARLLTNAQSLAQSQDELIGTTLAFNLSFDEQGRVLDAAANAGRNYGASIEQILQGLPGVAEQARAAGLSIEETSNLISLAISRSAMSGTGVASLVNRVFGNITNRPDNRQLLSSLGVDVSGSAGQTLENLAVRWDKLTKAQQNQVVAALGGHEVAKALLPILNEGSNLLDRNADSYNNAGYATELYYARLHTLGGMIRTLGGDAQQIGYDLARTGLLDLLGGVVAIMHPVLEGVDALLKLYNLIPGSIRPWLTGLVEVYALLVLIGRHQAVIAAETAATGGAAVASGAAQAGGGLLGRVFARRGAAAATTAVAEEGAAAIGARAAAAGGLRSLGAALAGPAGVVLGLVALTAAVGGTVEAYRNEAAARKEGNKALDQLRSGSTPDQLRSAASALSNAAVEQKHANSGIFGAIARTPDDEMRVNLLREQARWANAMAESISAEQRRAAGTGGAGEFFTNTGDWATDMSSGLLAMQQAGVPAVRQLEILTGAIQATGDAAAVQAAQLDRNGVYATRATVGTLATVALSAASSFRPPEERPFDVERVNEQQLGKRPNVEMSRYREQLEHDLDLVNGQAVQDAIDQILAQRGLGPTDVIASEDQVAIVDAVVRAIDPGTLTAKTRDALTGAISTALRRTFEAQANQPIPALRDQASLDAFVQGVASDNLGGGKAAQLDPYLQYLRGQNDPRVVDSSLDELRAEVEFLTTLANAAKSQGLGGQSLAIILQRLHSAQHDLVAAEIARIERLRQHDLSQATSPAEIEAANATRIEQEVRVAIAQDDPSALIGVLNSTDRAVADRIRKHLESAVRIARAAYEAEAALVASIPPQLARARELMGGDIAGPADRSALDKAQHDLDLFSKAMAQSAPGGGTQDANALATSAILARPAAGDAVAAARAARDAALYSLQHAKNQTEYNQALRQYKDAQYALTQAIVASASAARSASVRPGDPLSQATAAVENARASLAATVPGTTDFYNALGALRRAQYDFGQALLDHQHQVRLLGIDITDPVARAREDLRAAQAKLAYDQAHGTGDVVADRNAVREAQARAESAVFDQRLHDAQVAHDLGKLSDAAYLRFLESERDRLRAIAHKTRQQIEQLQQIDQAIKAAADEMQGQWNIGDIRIPTPYEARRYIQATGQNQPYQSTTTTHTTNTITFHGLDRRDVEDILRRLLGPEATGATTTTTRKV